MSNQLPLQPVSQETYEKKYQLRDKKGNPIDENVDGTFRRVAKALAGVEREEVREEWEQRFYEAMQMGATPAGRIMSNAGAEQYKPATSLINCTVSRVVSDEMEGILQALYEAGITLKSGAGIGYCFSTLRPKGAWVSGVNASTSGPLSFMDIFDKLCGTISSAGGRRGAQMGTMHIGHPDIIDFITAKRQDGRLRQFNLSVLATDDFMQAVKNGGVWYLRFPIYKKEFEEIYADQDSDYVTDKFVDEYDDLMWSNWPETSTTNKVIRNAKGQVLCKIYKTLPARELWDLIMKSTYDYAEPGVLFIDRMNEYNNNRWCEEITGTNPCSEQPLPPTGSCLLGSINLINFVSNPFTQQTEFLWDKYREIIRVFTRMLDNVVEINGLPLPSQRHEITHKRRHGMGILGLGSALTMLGIRYGSKEAVEFTGDIMRVMELVGLQENLALAKEKGPAPIMGEWFEITEDQLRLYPQMEADGYMVGEKVKGKVFWSYSKYLNKVAEDEKSKQILQELREVGGRFTHHTSIAPTGTIAFTFGNNADSGIEPAFSHSYFRNLTVQGKKSRQQQEVMSYEFLLYRHLFGEDIQTTDLPKDIFVGSDDVPVKQHIDMQAEAQKYTDSAISKTINVPTDYPFEDFKDLYMYAYEKGLKGTTTFRFNPDTLQGVLVRQEDLESTTYKFTLEDGTVVAVPGSETVVYEGEEHNAAMLYDAIKEGRYHTGY